MSYTPPWYLKNGLVMTFHFALRGYLIWERHTVEPEPIYHNHIFIGANGVPIYGKYATPKHPKGTIIATNPEAVARVNSIQTFAHELAIENLGFNSVEDYYQASAPLNYCPTA